MAKPQILLVDADPRSVRLLEVSLKNEGFMVTHASDGADALEKLAYASPDLILTDTRLPRLDGFEFAKAVRNQSRFAGLPIIFLASNPSLEDKLRGIATGADDYLTRPILIRELITRVHMLLARSTQRHMVGQSGLSKTQLSGTLEDMGVVDLLQTIEASRKSGTAEIVNGSETAIIRFQDGRAADAELGRLRGEEAVYRTLVWTTGTFVVDFQPVDFEETITTSTQALLMEGMRRMDEWGRLAEQLPSLSAVFQIDTAKLVERIGEMPDELNPIVRLLDGSRSLAQLIDDSPFDDLSTLSVVSKLYFEGLLDDITVSQVVSEGVVPGTSGAPPLASGHVRRSLRPSVPAVYSADELLKPLEEPSPLSPRTTTPVLADPGIRSGDAARTLSPGAEPAAAAVPAAVPSAVPAAAVPAAVPAAAVPAAAVPAAAAPAAVPSAVVPSSVPPPSVSASAVSTHEARARVDEPATEDYGRAARVGNSTLLGMGRLDQGRLDQGPPARAAAAANETRPGPPVGYVLPDEPAPTTRRGHRPQEATPAKAKQVTLMGFAAPEAVLDAGASSATQPPHLSAAPAAVSSGEPRGADADATPLPRSKRGASTPPLVAEPASAVEEASGPASEPEDADFDAFFETTVASRVTRSEEDPAVLGPVPGVPTGGAGAKLGLVALAAVALLFVVWLVRGRTDPQVASTAANEGSATPALSAAPPPADSATAAELEPQPEDETDPVEAPGTADPLGLGLPTETAAQAGTSATSGLEPLAAPLPAGSLKAPRRKTLRLPPPKTKPPVAAFPTE